MGGRRGEPSSVQIWYHGPFSPTHFLESSAGLYTYPSPDYCGLGVDGQGCTPPALRLHSFDSRILTYASPLSVEHIAVPAGVYTRQSDQCCTLCTLQEPGSRPRIGRLTLRRVLVNPALLVRTDDLDCPSRCFHSDSRSRREYLISCCPDTETDDSGTDLA